MKREGLLEEISLVPGEVSKRPFTEKKNHPRLYNFILPCDGGLEKRKKTRKLEQLDFPLVLVRRSSRRRPEKGRDSSLLRQRDRSGTGCLQRPRQRLRRDRSIRSSRSGVVDRASGRSGGGDGGRHGPLPVSLSTRR